MHRMGSVKNLILDKWQVVFVKMGNYGKWKKNNKNKIKIKKSRKRKGKKYEKKQHYIEIFLKNISLIFVTRLLLK